ncbi:GPR1/FUN34/YaaH-class plasma membrane protein-like protein [Amylocarpus encephaloides]|uniref:GPR1/FUN34/YaaH-class plasma membrane protein-like protein n=1 Tax=Amylocarpus encephaloides TaxID=45428 RepID=A0A9P7YDL0_9HELO|nr:GPR1/FUN34/YaaH-class plasma membrane protein-like protein [Amylocarpus encephaloides]
MAAEPNAQARSNGEPLEKDFSHQNGMNGYNNGANSYHMNDMNMGHGDALRQIRTAGSISISPELFEKIYLSPQNAVKGDLRQTFGNPTPVALIGFLLCLSPLSCDLMGWRGSGGNGAAGIGSYYFFGGLLMIIGGFLEFILGNTFPFVVFTSFGAFWLTFAATLQPFYMAYGLYAPPGGTPAEGLATVGFTASFGFFLLFMAVLCFIYLVCSLRTNVVFVVIFFTLVVGFGLLAGAYWQNANAIGNSDPSAAALAGRLQIAAGAFTFVASMAGWWIFAAIMLAALDFPFQIPVGDLSTMIKGASEKEKAKER